MRARMLKPGFFKNEELAAFEPLTRVLFAGLWCLADREGRLEDRPARIRAELLPYDIDADVDAMLTALAAGPDPFIVRYEAAGHRYIQVVAFGKHQSPHVREPASSIPAAGGSPINADEHRASTGPAPVEHRAGPAEYGIQSRNTESESVVSMATPASPRVRSIRSFGPNYSTDFEAWWRIFPRHDAKSAAWAAYEKRRKANRSFRVLEQAAEHFRDYCDEYGTPTDKIPHASTWLNQHRDEEWEHGPPDAGRKVVAKNGHAPPSKSARNFEILRDLAKEMIDDDSPGDAPLGLPAGRVPDAGRRGVHAEDVRRLPLRRPLA